LARLSGNSEALCGRELRHDARAFAARWVGRFSPAAHRSRSISLAQIFGSCVVVEMIRDF